MNKHILSYSQKINESIGKGSVLLIKGKQMQDGRYLYVTTINGYSEIKPGLVMVFIGDIIYRVIYKGNNKFSGRKVDYRGEEGLKGMFNMRNEGKPSLVLNNNKTPFHWLTLKHTDVGAALRELGPRLFGHELILEEYETEKKADVFLTKELIKKLLGKESAINIISANSEEADNFEYNAEESEDGLTDWEWSATVKLSIDDDAVPSEYVEYLRNMSALSSTLLDDVLTSEFGLDRGGLDVDLYFTSYANVKHEFDPGDYATAPYSSTEIVDAGTELSSPDFVFIDGGSIEADDELMELVKEYDLEIRSDVPDDILSSINKLSR